jgi:hypothetical protein
MTLDEKLDWIAYRLMKLTLSVGEGLNGQEVDEYTRIFKEQKPKPEENNHKGLFLK